MLQPSDLTWEKKKRKIYFKMLFFFLFVRKKISTDKVTKEMFFRLHTQRNKQKKSVAYSYRVEEDTLKTRLVSLKCSP